METSVTRQQRNEQIVESVIASLKAAGLDDARTSHGYVLFSRSGRTYTMKQMTSRHGKVAGFTLSNPYRRGNDRFPLNNSGSINVARMLDLIDARRKADEAYTSQRIASDAIKEKNWPLVERAREMAVARGLSRYGDVVVEPSGQEAGRVILRIGAVHVNAEQAQELIALFARLRSQP